MAEKKSYIPSPEECQRLMEAYAMLPNIVLHSKQVMRVSVALTEHLSDTSMINKKLVLAGALLHDIAKTRTIQTGEMRHDLIGGRIMRELGCSDIAWIVESHVFFNDFKPDGKLEEREIVYYADKRVMHDTIVSLDTRIDDLADRYGRNSKIISLIRNNKIFITQIEKKIESFLRIPIGDILKEI